MQWFRWYHGTCSDPKLGSVARKTESSRERVIAVWAMLLESASESGDRGAFAVDADGIADVLNCATSSVQAILDEMSARGMLSEGRVTAFDRRNFTSDDSTERVRKHRERRRNADETLHGAGGNAEVTPPDTDTDTDTEKEPPAAVAAKPKRSKKPEPAWYAPLSVVWRATCGGNLPRAVLKQPDRAEWDAAADEVGVDELSRRLARYLSTTEPRFISHRRFASLHATFADAIEGKKALEELYELGKQDPWWTSGLRVPA